MIRVHSLRRSHVGLFLVVLLIVAVAEAAVMIVLPFLLPWRTSGPIRALVDSCLLTLLCAPWLWWWIIRPLRHLALTEEAKSQALGVAATEGIITFDQRGVIDSFNPAAEQIFGFRAAEIIGGDLGTLFPWQFLVRHEREAASRAGASGCAGTAGPPGPHLLSGVVKIPGRRQDGSEVPLAVSISEVRVDSRALYTAAVRNLIDRERDAMRAEQMAAVGQLGTALAHQLRNALTSIKMLVQAGRRQDQSLTLAGEDLELIEDEVRRMERALQTFLDFARPPKLECRRLPLDELVSDAVAQAQHRAGPRGIVLRVASPGGGLSIQGDRDQLRRVLLHLVQNAIDAGPPGSTVDVVLRGPQDGQIELRVLDTGPGISPQVFSQLFQPFVTTKTTGAGLGLAISRRIAEDHGGSLSAYNRPEGGAGFLLKLPAS
jgi:PAS domain S-box-containing protein